MQRMGDLRANSPRGQVVALLGAESTGKTTLARALRRNLLDTGYQVALVEEYLREFCDKHGRTPRRDEQFAIAAEQTLRIEAAARAHQFVIADTSALMIAVYSEYVFGDRDLHALALQAQAVYSHTLVTALDIPWQADAHQRTGAHVREPVDALLRAAMAGAGIEYCVVHGSGPARLTNALAALGAARWKDRPSGDRERAPARRWQWTCERCSDPQCERRLLARSL